MHPRVISLLLFEITCEGKKNCLILLLRDNHHFKILFYKKEFALKMIQFLIDILKSSDNEFSFVVVLN